MRKVCLSIILLVFSIVTCYAMEPQNERTDAFEAIVTAYVVSSYDL